MMRQQHLAELDLPVSASPLVDDVPPNIRESIDCYVHYGIRPGGFVIACLRNDLMDAVSRADDDSLDNLRQIMHYVYHCVPGNLWGTEAEVLEHLARGRKARPDD